MSNIKRGKFIVFEGLDGSGKGTQIKILTDKLKSMGHTLYSTAEPTVSATGGLIRDTLGGFTKRSSYELGALFLTDRIFHNINPINGIKKFLDEGIDVICDRYYYSSFAYQGLDANLDWIMNMNLNCPEIEKPDLCIYLDVSAKECDKRIQSDRRHTEIFENYDTIIKTRNRFFEVFKKLEGKENIVVISSDGDIESISRDIFREVEKII